MTRSLIFFQYCLVCMMSVGILLFIPLSALAFSDRASIQPGSKPDISNPILIFVSSSMPDDSLKAWLEQAHRLNAPVLIRGWIQDSAVHTQAKLAALSPEGKYSLTLEPRLFKTYHIMQVPTVVVRADSDTEGSYAMVVGDIGLESALSYIANHTTDSKVQTIVESALHTLKTSI